MDLFQILRSLVQRDNVIFVERIEGSIKGNCNPFDDVRMSVLLMLDSTPFELIDLVLNGD
jgi:hypothetical protein